MASRDDVCRYLEDVKLPDRIKRKLLHLYDVSSPVAFNYHISRLTSFIEDFTRAHAKPPVSNGSFVRGPLQPWAGTQREAEPGSSRPFVFNASIGSRAANSLQADEYIRVAGLSAITEDMEYCDGNKENVLRNVHESGYRRTDPRMISYTPDPPKNNPQEESYRVKRKAPQRSKDLQGTPRGGGRAKKNVPVDSEESDEVSEEEVSPPKKRKEAPSKKKKSPENLTRRKVKTPEEAPSKKKKSPENVSRKKVKTPEEAPKKPRKNPKSPGESTKSLGESSKMLKKSPGDSVKKTQKPPATNKKKTHDETPKGKAKNKQSPKGKEEVLEKPSNKRKPTKTIDEDSGSELSTKKKKQPQISKVEKQPKKTQRNISKPAEKKEKPKPLAKSNAEKEESKKKQAFDDSEDESLSSFLRSAKKSVQELVTETPPTRALNSVIMEISEPESDPETRTPVAIKPKNKKWVARVANMKNDKNLEDSPEVKKSKPKNKAGPVSREVENMVEAATSKHLRTPEPLKNVFENTLECSDFTDGYGTCGSSIE